MLISVCLLIGLTVFSQEITPAQVPVKVKQAFAKQYPAAKAVKYGIDNTTYKISFLEQGKVLHQVQQQAKCRSRVLDRTSTHIRRRRGQLAADHRPRASKPPVGPAHGRGRGPGVHGRSGVGRGCGHQGGRRHRGRGLQSGCLLVPCRRRIADYKVPERILFLPSLPKGLTGKVQRRDLKDILLVSQQLA